MAKRRNNTALAHKRRGQGSEGFCTVEVHLANLGAEESGQTHRRQRRSAFGKVFLWQAQAAPSLQGQPEGKGHSSTSGFPSWDTILTVTRSTAQNQPPKLVRASALQSAEHPARRCLLPRVSWAVLYCSSLTCFISCRLWSLASLWFTIGKG